MVATEKQQKQVQDLCEGNPGALSVLIQLAKYPDWSEMMTYLQEQDIRGSNIWIQYKDENKENIEEFADWIRSQIDFIRQNDD